MRGFRLPILLAAAVALICLLAATTEVAAAERQPLRNTARALCAAPVRLAALFPIRPRLRHQVTVTREACQTTTTTRQRTTTTARPAKESRPATPRATCPGGDCPLRNTCPGGTCPR